MYRHARSILEEFLSQHPLSYQYHSRSLSNEAAPCPRPNSPRDKATPRRIRIRTVQIHKDKRAQDFTKEKVVFLYALLCNRLINPFLDLIIPGMKREDHLSNLTDFRQGLCPITLHSKGSKTCYSRCLEEPTPFKLKKALEIEDCVIKDPRLVFKNKIKSKIDFARVLPANFKSLIRKVKSDDKHGNSYSLWYKIFLKRPVDSKVESLTPNIYGSNLGRLCDFRAHDDAFMLGQSQHTAELGKDPLMVHPFSSTPGIKRNKNEVHVKDDRTFSPPLRDKTENALIIEMHAPPKKVTQIIENEPKEVKNIALNQISEMHDIENLNISSIKLSTSSKPQIKLDQGVSAKTNLNTDSESVLSIPSKVSIDAKVLTNETMRNNNGSMKTIPSSEQEYVLTKSNSNKKFLTPFKVKAKKTMIHIKETRKSIKINEKEVTRKYDEKQINVNVKRISPQNKSKREINGKYDIEKKDKLRPILGQSNKKNMENAEIKTDKPPMQTEKLMYKNKMDSNAVSATKSRINMKLEYKIQSQEPSGNNIKGKKHNEIGLKNSEILERRVKLKEVLDESPVVNENQQLVEKETKNKHTLNNTPNKPKFTVKTNLKISQNGKLSNKKKTQGRVLLGDSTKAKLVTFKTTEEEPYFVTKDKNLNGVQSDLMSIANVVESEEIALKSQNSVPPQNEKILAKHKNIAKSIEENLKHSQHQKLPDGKTDNLKSFELVHMQGLSAIDTAPTFGLSHQNKEEKHDDMSKKYRNRSKQPLGLRDNGQIKQAHTQYVTNNKNKHQSANKIIHKPNDFIDNYQHQPKNQAEASNADLKTNAEMNLKNKSNLSSEKRNPAQIPNNSGLKQQIGKVDLSKSTESFKANAANNAGSSQTSRNFKLTKHGVMDSNLEIKQSNFNKVKLQDDLNTQNHSRTANQGGITAKNLDETNTDIKRKITRKSMSVEAITKGLINNREKNEVYKNPKLNLNVLKSGEVNELSISRSLKIEDKTLMPDDIKASNNTEVDRELKLSIVKKSDNFRESRKPEKNKSNILRESRSLDKTSKSKVLDSNFELNKEVLKIVSTNSENKSEKPVMLNTKTGGKGTLNVPKPQFDSKKEGIRIIKDKQKETFSEMSKKRDEKFNLLKNESNTNLDFKIDVINKKIPRENLKTTATKSVSENKLSKYKPYNKTEDDKLLPKKSRALQNSKMDNVTYQVIAKQGEKATSQVWSSKSVDQISSHKESMESRSNKSFQVLEKNLYSPVPKISAVLSKTPDKVTNVETQAAGTKSDQFENSHLKATLNIQQSSKQQSTQLDKNKTSNINAVNKKTPGSSVKKESVDMIGVSFKKSVENGRMNDVQDFLYDEKIKINKGQGMKSSSNIEHSTTTKCDEPVYKSKSEISINDNVSKENTNKLTKINGQPTNMKARNISQQTNPSAKGDKLTGKSEQSKLEVQKNGFSQREEKNKLAELKNPPINLKMENILQKPSKNSKGNESNQISKVDELIGKGGQSQFAVEKNYRTQREEKNKVDELRKIQPANFKTRSGVKKSSDNSKGNESTKNPTVDELIGKGEQRKFEVRKNDLMQMAEKNKVAEVKLQSTNLKTEKGFLKVSENSEGKESTKNSKVDQLIEKGEQSKFKSQKNDLTRREEKNNGAELKLQLTNLKKENVLQKTSENANADRKSSKGKFEVPKYDYGKSKENKNKAFELKVPLNLTTKNKSQDTSRSSKVEVENIGKSDERKYEPPPKLAQREEIHKNAELKTQTTNLKTKNVPQQINTKGRNSRSVAEKPPQSLGENKEGNKMPKFDCSEKKESKNKGDLQVKSMKIKQQHFSEQTLTKNTNLPIKKSGSLESIVEIPKKQLGELGRSKTTLEKTIQHILQGKSVVNIKKEEQQNNVGDMKVNENSSLGKHRPIAKVSAPILPNIKGIGIAKLNVENKINVKVQSNSASKDRKKIKEVRDGSESRTNMIPMEKIKERHR